MNLDDRLAQNIAIRGFESINGDGEYFGNLDDNSIEVIKQAILSDLLEIIGENKEQPRPLDEESRARFYRVGGQNFIKNELRDKVRKYCV